MTTIACDGRVMAADGLSALDGDCIVALNKSKMHRLKDGSIFGSAGNNGDRLNVLEWLQQGGKNPRVNHFVRLILKGDGRIVLLDVDLHTDNEIDAPAAVGSGGQLALGAMLPGASPKEAVAIAAQRDPHTGGKIALLSLK